MGIIKKIDHVGIVVKRVDEAIPIFEKVFGAKLVAKNRLDIMQLISCPMILGENRVELMEPTDEKGLIGKFIESRGEGLHHVSLQVEDIDEVIKVLEENNIRITGKYLDGKYGPNKTVFVHPKSTFGVLIEIIQRMV